MRPALFRLLALVALLACREALAVPACPGWHEGQAAGRPFRFQLMGDEFASWAVAEDGNTLLQDSLGIWRHARPLPDGGLARSAAYQPGSPREDSRGLRPSPQWLRRQVEPLRARRQARRPLRSERVEGQWNVLLILIHYPDQQPIIPAQNFDRMMDETGWRGTGSFNDYFQDLSYGRYGTQATVTVWYEAEHEHDYYGYNAGWGRSQELVREAVLAADAEVDFNPFDNDGNGVVDGLLIVHSGMGAEEGEGSNIWSHRWALWGQELELDGVTVSDYTMQPELQSGAQSAIGVYVHEFGHALGLPDLYDTDYSSSGVGSWCVMSGGSWGGSGGGNAHVPVAMSAYCRQALGWATVTTTAGELLDYGLPAVPLSDEIIRLELDNAPGQYFLAENRPLTGWDRQQAAGGLYIWHVDENMDGNSEDDHYLVDLEQADGRRDLNQGGNSDPGDIYPGAANNRLFSSLTQPSSLPYGGLSSTVSIADIGDAADTLHATYFQTFTHQDLSWEGWRLGDGGGADQWPDPGEEIGLVLQVRNRGHELASLELTLRCSEPGIALLDSVAVLGPVPVGLLLESPVFHLALAEDLPAGDYELVLRSRDGAGWTQEISGLLQVGRRPALLYFDGVDGALADWYRLPLAALERPAELRARAAGATPPTDLAAYPTVFWVTAGQAAPLSAHDLAAMDTYLAGGGRLFLSGQHLLDGVGETGRALLGADPGPSWSGPPLLHGLSAGGLVADNETLLLTGAGGAWNQELPATTLQPRADAVAAARWGSGNLPALLLRENPAWGGGRLVLAGFSVEAIHGAANLLERGTLLERALAWLDNGSEVGVGADAARPAALELRARPNPFNPATELGFTLARPGPARLRVWNLAGQLVRELELGALPAGAHTLRLELPEAASGVYLAQLDDSRGGRATARLLLLR